jgi:hypothetical protein
MNATTIGAPLDLNPGRTGSGTGRPGGNEIDAPLREYWTLPGFCWNARVTTSFGDLPVQALRLRDPLRTSDGGFALVQWIDELKLEEGFLEGFPDAQPIMIGQGALGLDRPKTSIAVSPHQRLAVGDARFSPDLRMARDLLDRPGVMRRPEGMVRYFVFHCGKPVNVMVEGVCVHVAP